MSGPILLVEDDPDDAELFRLAAREAELPGPIVNAPTGEEALELLLRQSLRPALVLLDIKLPGIDGLEVLRRLRSDPGARGLRIFMLTSSDLNQDEAEARGLGCDEYLTKPSSFSGYVALAESVKARLV